MRLAQGFAGGGVYMLLWKDYSVVREGRALSVAIVERVVLRTLFDSCGRTGGKSTHQLAPENTTHRLSYVLRDDFGLPSLQESSPHTHEAPFNTKFCVVEGGRAEICRLDCFRVRCVRVRRRSTQVCDGSQGRNELQSAEWSQTTD